MNKLLMIAFHYPPYVGGSGIHRTLKFTQYLFRYDWQPIVLTAHPRAYPRVGDEELNDIPKDVIVKRAFALDTARHLSVSGSFLRSMAMPDRWISWWIGGVMAGYQLVKKHNPSFIWSTYPIATAHLIGLALHRMTKVPWIVDLRDSMTEDNYPRDRMRRKCFQWIERKAMQYGRLIIFTTPSARDMYLDRYSWLSPERCLVIPNGFDEEDFRDLPQPLSSNGQGVQSITLLHAGVIYPEERNPLPFFRALSRLKKHGLIDAKGLKIDLRGAGSEEFYGSVIKDLDVDDVISLLPAVSHRQALEDCTRADALLLFQAASCDHQIPAKLYEYLRIGKPILALTSFKGDTARVLQECGGATVIDLENEEALVSGLPGFLQAVSSGAHRVPDHQQACQYSRQQLTSSLAAHLSRLVNNHQVPTR